MTTANTILRRVCRIHRDESACFKWYRSFDCRRNASFESIDAVLTTPIIESPAHLLSYIQKRSTPIQRVCALLV